MKNLISLHANSLLCQSRYGGGKSLLISDLNTMNVLTRYAAPEIFVVSVGVPEVLCESPVPGGNESLVYEDWGNGGN